MCFSWWLKLNRHLASFLPILPSSRGVFMMQVFCILLASDLLRVAAQSRKNPVPSPTVHNSLWLQEAVSMMAWQCCCLLHNLTSPFLIRRFYQSFFQLPPVFSTEEKNLQVILLFIKSFPLCTIHTDNFLSLKDLFLSSLNCTQFFPLEFLKPFQGI